jgi:hypothetical protein
VIRASWPLWAAHLAGNALLLWLGYYWLGLGESHAPALLWSAVVALAIVAAACWLHGAAFAWFADAKPRLRRVFAASLRRLLPLVCAAAVAVLVYVLANLAENAASAGSFKVASWLTLKLRKPVRPSAMLRVCAVVFWLVRWVVLPVFLLPMVAGVAARGWRGIAESGAMARRRLYWVEAPLLLLCALWLAPLLYRWTPHMGSFGLQMASFVVRLAAAYFLGVTAWLALAFVTALGVRRQESGVRSQELRAT